MHIEKRKDAVYIGYGESTDPLPEQPQLTRYRVFAGPCKECGCAGRKMVAAADVLLLVCDKCHNTLKTTIQASDMPEVTYIYWCNSSKFASDLVELSDQDRQMLAEAEKLLGSDYEVPHWAVTVIAGRCSSSEMCVNSACSYLIKSQ